MNECVKALCQTIAKSLGRGFAPKNKLFFSQFAAVFAQLLSRSLLCFSSTPCNYLFGSRGGFRFPGDGPFTSGWGARWPVAGVGGGEGEWKSQTRASGDGSALGSQM